MNNIDEIYKRAYPLEIIEDSLEGGYVATYPDLKGCVTVGETLEEVVQMAEEAKRLWIEDMLKRNMEIPEANELGSYSGQITLRIPKSLHRNLAKRAKRENVSMNQYCSYLLANSI